MSSSPHLCIILLHAPSIRIPLFQPGFQLPLRVPTAYKHELLLSSAEKLLTWYHLIVVIEHAVPARKKHTPKNDKLAVFAISPYIPTLLDKFLGSLQAIQTGDPRVCSRATQSKRNGILAKTDKRSGRNSLRSQPTQPSLSESKYSWIFQPIALRRITHGTWVWKLAT